MQLLWSANLGVPPRGMSLARERGWLLVWDSRNKLHIFEGKRQLRELQTAPLAGACIADDGSAIAALGAAGEVWFFGPDLKPLWEKKLPRPGQAVAIDSFGQFLAASDSGGNILLFDRHGRVVAEAQTPRPLRRLTFVPERPFLVGAADFGLVACFDAKLECAWRDGLVANVGSLSATGDGGTIALAGFSPGLYCYSLEGPPHRWLALPAPCRQAALRYDGKIILMVNQANGLQLVDREQHFRDEHALASTAVEIALAPLGDRAFAALADGTLLALEPSERRR